MLAGIGSRWLVVLLIGIALLGSYSGCHRASYGKSNSESEKASRQSDGAYVVGNEVYYPCDSSYDPYAAYNYKVIAN